MKKVFLAIAAIAMSVAVNAQVVTGADWMSSATKVNFNLASDGVNYDYPGGNVEATATDGVLTVTYAGQTSTAEPALKIGADYLRPNKGSGFTYDFQVNPGETVAVGFKSQKSDNSGTITILTGTGTTPFELPSKTDVTLTVTADAAGKISLQPSTSSLDIKSYTRGAVAGVENASADAKEVKFFNVSGQEVAADAEGFVFGTDGSKKFNK